MRAPPSFLEQLEEQTNTWKRQSSRLQTL